jgi:alkylated DNA repair dioxygenase AlkB
LNIAEFCKSFNDATKDKMGYVIPAEVTIYKDRSYTFKLKTPLAAELLKKAAGIEKGSGEPNKKMVGKVNRAQLKEIAEKLANASFNSCLLNLYHNGTEGVGWHSDDEKALGRAPAIASMTFGAEREFRFRHKTKPLAASVILEPGSLLVMKDATQANWRHSLPRTKKILAPRINLTFRKML